MSRVRAYSRSSITPPSHPSPTGLSPPAVTRSSGLRLHDWTTRRTCRSLHAARTTPIWHRRQALPPHRFGLLPVRSPLLRGCSLFLGVREMFQFPRCPPRLLAVAASRGWVAPFGDRGINACSRLPRAYRRNATSFIGTQRRGIHQLLLVSSLAEHSTRNAECVPFTHVSSRCTLVRYTER